MTGNPVGPDRIRDMFDTIKESDLVLLLISDGAQSELFSKVFELMKPGATRRLH